jgi:probable HAF family extracellular repeat protein
MIKSRSAFCTVLVSALEIAFILPNAVGASFHRLGTLAGGNTSFAYAISADGSVVVGESTSDGFGTAPFRWTQQIGMVSLLPSQTNNYGSAFAVSAGGDVIVGTAVVYAGTELEVGGAFVWRSDTGIQRLAINDNGYANAWGVSGDGSVIVGEWKQDQRAAGTVPCAWWDTNGPFTVFDTEASMGNQRGLFPTMARQSQD